MTWNIASLCLLTALTLTSCDKIKLPFSKRKVVAAPTPAPAVVRRTPPPSTPQPKPPPAAPPIDTTAEVVVLCYHRLEGKAGGALSIEPALFEEHMRRIKDDGLSVISMRDFLAWRRGEKSIPPKSVLITIDDGYVSSYKVGWPILKKYGYPFTMFLYLNYIGVGGKSVSWEQLAEMRDAGVDIGGHTISHQDLRSKPKNAPGDYDTWLKDEVDRSKRVLEEKLGIRVSTIAYPFGLHNEKVHAACREAGYEAGFTTYGQRLGHTASAFALGRYDITTRDAQGRDSFSVAISFQGMLAPGSSENVVAQDAATSMITQPASGETIRDPMPTIQANLATMGSFDANTVEMRISGLDLVPASYDPATKTVSYTVTQKLRPGRYTVIIGARSGGRRMETRWSFHFDPNAAAPGGAAAGLNEPLPARPARR
ncbi:MAG: polysaccharide deacetylase family protein [Verrucomicrobiota bacterium]|nr:polysaccharide deacetylase family protein [Verrucomicrobiota bacterium]